MAESANEHETAWREACRLLRRRQEQLLEATVGLVQESGLLQEVQNLHDEVDVLFELERELFRKAFPAPPGRSQRELLKRELEEVLVKEGEALRHAASLREQGSWSAAL